MYQGDGSYKQVQSEYNTEVALIDLLHTEKELVDKYNSLVRAVEISKKNYMRVSGYIEDINKVSIKLEETRKNIKLHFINELGIKTDIVESLYND